MKIPHHVPFQISSLYTVSLGHNGMAQVPVPIPVRLDTNGFIKENGTGTYDENIIGLALAIRGSIIHTNVSKKKLA